MFDDIDMMIMQHTMVDENVKATAGGAVGKGFIAKYIRYIGKEAMRAARLTWHQRPQCGSDRPDGCQRQP